MKLRNRNSIALAFSLVAAAGLLAGCNSTKKPLGVSRLKEEPPELIYVSGEFRTPGNYPWTNGMTLRDGIQAAGGFTDFARGAVRLVHWDDSRETIRLGPGRSVTNNPTLDAGDQIISPRN